jgi:hypothetical protein
MYRPLVFVGISNALFLLPLGWVVAPTPAPRSC